MNSQKQLNKGENIIMKTRITRELAEKIYDEWKSEEIQEMIEGLEFAIKRENRNWEHEHSSYSSKEERQERQDRAELLESIRNRSFWFKFALVSNCRFEY